MDEEMSELRDSVRTLDEKATAAGMRTEHFESTAGAIALQRSAASDSVRRDRDDDGRGARYRREVTPAPVRDLQLAVDDTVSGRLTAMFFFNPELQRILF